jgi:hypothetical protein
VAAALVAAGAGSVLAAVPAAAAAHGTAASSCTVRWTGNGHGRLWTDPENWSTGKVPGASDNVCIINPPINDTVLTTVPVTVHSLLLRAGGSIELRGSAAKPVTFTVATTVTMTKGPVLPGFIQMENATLEAAQIISHQGTIFAAGTCHVISPHIVFADQSDLEAFTGTTTVSSLSELSIGALTGVSVLASDQSTVVLPGDITHLASAHVTVLAGSAIDDPAGHTALSGLTSVDARSSLEDHNNLTLTGASFTDDGRVDFGPGTLAIEGPFTQTGRLLILQPQSTLSAGTDTTKSQLTNTRPRTGVSSTVRAAQPLSVHSAVAFCAGMLAGSRPAAHPPRGDAARDQRCAPLPDVPWLHASNRDGAEGAKPYEPVGSSVSVLGFRDQPARPDAEAVGDHFHADRRDRDAVRRLRPCDLPACARRAGPRRVARHPRRWPVSTVGLNSACPYEPPASRRVARHRCLRRGLGLAVNWTPRGTMLEAAKFV